MADDNASIESLETIVEKMKENNETLSKLTEKQEAENDIQVLELRLKDLGFEMNLFPDLESDDEEIESPREIMSTHEIDKQIDKIPVNPLALHGSVTEIETQLFHEKALSELNHLENTLKTMEKMEKEAKSPNNPVISKPTPNSETMTPFGLPTITETDEDTENENDKKTTPRPNA